MSSVAEIESAIERLSTRVVEIAACLEEYQQMISACAEIFAMYEKERVAVMPKRRRGEIWLIDPGVVQNLQLDGRNSNLMLQFVYEYLSHENIAGN